MDMCSNDCSKLFRNKSPLLHEMCHYLSAEVECIHEIRMLPNALWM